VAVVAEVLAGLRSRSRLPAAHLTRGAESPRADTLVTRVPGRARVAVVAGRPVENWPGNALAVGGGAIGGHAIASRWEVRGTDDRRTRTGSILAGVPARAAIAVAADGSVRFRGIDALARSGIASGGVVTIVGRQADDGSGSRAGPALAGVHGRARV